MTGARLPEWATSKAVRYVDLVESGQDFSFYGYVFEFVPPQKFVVPRFVFQSGPGKKVLILPHFPNVPSQVTEIDSWGVSFPCLLPAAWLGPGTSGKVLPTLVDACRHIIRVLNLSVVLTKEEEAETWAHLRS